MFLLRWPSIDIVTKVETPFLSASLGLAGFKIIEVRNLQMNLRLLRQPSLL
jgi:hypothetical protein